LPLTDAPMLLGFDFFGAGNIGDDLMLGGFLRALQALRPGRQAPILGTTPWDRASQASRFPEIQWLDAAAIDQSVATRSDFIWVGPGDTPFQMSVGPWILDHLQRQKTRWGRCARRVMVNVGAESEIGGRESDFAAIAADLDRISVRDEHTRAVLVNRLGVQPERISVGADLAHIALADPVTTRPIPRRAFDLGVILAADTLSAGDVEAIGRLIAERKTPVAFLTHDIRIGPGFERGVFADLTRRLGSAFRDNAVLLVPPYAEGSLADLIAPIALCEIVLTTRYHGAVVAAWTGARVAAIGRSSKVTSVAAELGIPCGQLPLNLNDLHQLLETAAAVPRAKLLALRDQALRGVAFALEIG
jgi:hypothetical protein